MESAIMGKRGRWVVLFVLAGAGCWQLDKSTLIENQLARVEKAGTPKDPNGLAVSVAGQTITSGEIIQSLSQRLRLPARTGDFESFKEQAAPHVRQALTDKVSYFLLYERAKRDLGNKIDLMLEKEVEDERRKFLAGFGGDSVGAEEYLKAQGWDWDSFRQVQKNLALISLQQPRTRPVTYSDLLDCYNRMKEESFAVDARITVRVIEIQPARLVASNPSHSVLEKARELAESLVGRIRAGEDFGELARQYSHGHRREFGGLWKARRPESLAEPYDLLAAEAGGMQPGDISGPIETAGAEHIFIVRLEEKQPKGFRPLSEVQRQVEYRVLADRKKEAAEELDAGLAELAALEEEDRFIDFCVRRMYQMRSR
jgi:peptidyl-prolyl cis-trans isomerase SurA